jgi:hypothetical protein
MAEDTLAAIRVIAFPGAPNLPTFAAVAQGFFCRARSVGSRSQPRRARSFRRRRSPPGEFEIAFTAFDNVVAYSEGQGAADGGNRTTA